MYKIEKKSNNRKCLKTFDFSIMAVVLKHVTIMYYTESNFLTPQLARCFKSSTARVHKI